MFACLGIKQDYRWDDIYELSESARIPDRWPVGKHKNELIGDAPLDYRQWFLKQDEVDPYLRQAIEATMPAEKPKSQQRRLFK